MLALVMVGLGFINLIPTRTKGNFPCELLYWKFPIELSTTEFHLEDSSGWIQLSESSFEC